MILRDFSILHGGHFGILATGADNLTIDNLKIDTNRDGMDIDSCRNVRVSNCFVNSPWDDGICLKADYATWEDSDPDRSLFDAREVPIAERRCRGGRSAAAGIVELGGGTRYGGDRCPHQGRGFHLPDALAPRSFARYAGCSVAHKTGARVIGTASTANLARAEGVPERQIQIVSGGEELKFDGFSVRVIRSLHGIFRHPRRAGVPRRRRSFRRLKAPVRFGQHVEGGTLAYSIAIDGHRIILFGSMNYIESEVNGLRPDVALIGAMPERNNIDEYTPRLMRALGNPPLVNSHALGSLQCSV